MTIEAWNNVHAERPWGRWPSTRFVEWAMRRFGNVPDRRKVRFLEIGCGAGAQLRFLSAEGFTVHGIDGSRHAIQQAAKVVSSGALTTGDLMRFEAAQPFDVVVDICTLQHLTASDAAAALVKARTEWLQPDGYLFSMFAAVGTTVEQADGVPAPRLLLSSEIPHLFAGLKLNIGHEIVKAGSGERRHWIIEGRLGHGTAAD